jgi:hypothetical protein
MDSTTTATDANLPVSGARDKNGRFVKGSKAGCRFDGRPRKEYYEQIDKRLTPAEFGECVAAMIKKAKDGDVRAFECLRKLVLPEELKLTMETETYISWVTRLTALALKQN